MGIDVDKASAELRMVSRFMDKAASVGVKNQIVRTTPTVPDGKERRLRARLILEEALELIAALGCYVEFGDDQFLAEDIKNLPRLRMGCLAVVCDGLEANLVDVADGAADLEYVVKGALLCCGITNDAEIFQAVHENNMAKFAVDADGKPKFTVSPEGKLIKPKDHPKVDLKQLVYGETK